MRTYIIFLSILSLVLSSPAEANTEIKDYIEIAKCFLDQQPLIDDVTAIVDMITAQDFSRAFTVLFKTYADVQAAIGKCLKKEIVLNELPNCCIFCKRFGSQDECFKQCGCSI